ncbi:hypothetical protein K3495_g1857 [Podosphaera aphanis]|nr:hypothetical protein K3495_g1857 [Podosphaera aphanis]
MVNCKARFETEERWKEFERFFSDVVHSITPEEYLDRVEEFKTEFNYNEGELYELPPANSPGDLARHTTKTLEQNAVRYALQQWLEPRHMNIVHAWTNQFFNRNTTTTSRLEGAHAVLKRWIGTPTKKLSSFGPRSSWHCLIRSTTSESNAQEHATACLQEFLENSTMEFRAELYSLLFMKPASRSIMHGMRNCERGMDRVPFVLGHSISRWVCPAGTSSRSECPKVEVF